MTESSAPHQPQRESTRRAWRLARKELREILRDRRTVITLILMPLLVYPLLGSVMSKGVMSSLASAKKIRVHIYVASVEQGQVFSNEILRGDRILLGDVTPPERPNADGRGESDVVFLATEPDLELSVFRIPEASNATLEQLVADGTADVGVRVRDVEPQLLTAGPRPQPFREWEILRREGSALSDRGFDAITKRLDAVNNDYIDRLVHFGLIPPVRVASVSSRSLKSEMTSSSPLVTFIPLVLVLMTMTGAVYPAIDLTAGERERGTMEILVAAPVPRMTLLAGKFVAVLTVALLTASMNLISMFATLFALGLEGSVLGSVGPTMIFQVIVLMVVFAAFFSAVLLSITSVARSFKEAQAYLIPLMLISLTPGIFALMPDVRINGLMAVTPLVNTVLMGRDLLQGNVNVLMFAIVLISTALYGVLALSLAARVFGSDAVLYGSSGTWTDLLKRPAESRDVASIPVSMSCLAVLFSLFIVVGGLPSRIETSLTNQLLINAGILCTLFVGVPFLFAGASRVRPLSGFAMKRPEWTAWAVAVLLGISLWPYLYELQILLMTEQRIEFVKELFERLELNLKAVPLWVKLLSLAIAPAVCEEFFFRGFLQNSIRRKSSAALSILSAGVLFGLFHVIVKDALLFERLVPSTIMGIVLGIVFERTRSVLPGMLLHALHNGLLLTVSEYEDQLSASNIGLSDRQHLPGWILLCAAVPVVIAAILLFRRRKSDPTASPV